MTQQHPSIASIWSSVATPYLIIESHRTCLGSRSHTSAPSTFFFPFVLHFRSEILSVWSATQALRDTALYGTYLFGFLSRIRACRRTRVSNKTTRLHKHLSDTIEPRNPVTVSPKSGTTLPISSRKYCSQLPTHCRHRYPSGFLSSARKEPFGMTAILQLIKYISVP